MSRIGKKEIDVPKGVVASLEGNTLVVKGPLGQLKRLVPPHVKVVVAEQSIHVSVDGDGRGLNAYQGLARALFANMVNGVTKGFIRPMAIVGVGYKVALDGKNLNFALGYSHPVVFPLPAGIDAEVADKGLSFVIKGIDRELVGQTCATIRNFRSPEPYKGKGIRYANEVVRQKAGKAGAK